MRRNHHHYLAHKESARALITERVRHFNTHYGVAVGKIAIRNQRSRWGSCSKKGNLNFNYKLAFLSEELRDYVIVHEICHIKEFNHGHDFWNLVAQQVPEHRALNKRLREVQAATPVTAPNSSRRVRVRRPRFFGNFRTLFFRAGYLG